MHHEQGSDGDRSTLLSFVSCGASQGYAPQSGEIIGILTVLFRYVGIGTRLALTSMGWLTVREASFCDIWSTHTLAITLCGALASVSVASSTQG